MSARMDLPEIAEDIRVASTLPGAAYDDPRFHAAVRARVMARSWQLVEAPPTSAGHVRPTTLLPGCLDEPLVLARDASGAAHCLSNVCTHRANLVVLAEGEASSLRCGYHGRRFALDGRCLSAPHFESAPSFPAPSDDLPRLSLPRWGPLAFTSIDPSVPFDDWIAPVRTQVPFLERSEWREDSASARAYDVAASWALYVDNYLEGLHVPFVHRGLSRVIDDDAYETVLFPHGTLQIGTARSDDDALDLPEASPDRGRRIAAYWFWLFPNLMLNFYPWGLSTNVVVPIAPDRTRVLYREWVLDPSRRGRGAGGDLDRVEREDDAIVEQVQRGTRARLYRAGRYSPTRETGVHHFHRMLVRAVNGA